MKIAVTGKGGVGKTTIAALLALEFARRDRRVYAIDADPDANLASMLGAPETDAIVPIVDMKEMIRERVGATSQDIGAYFTLNPRVDDIPDLYGVRLDGIRLLVLGHLPKARGGCACPENVFLRELVSHALTREGEVVILDMEAGIEHLGRGTAAGVDLMLIVIEPSRQSIETTRRIRRLAADLGVPRIAGVINKAASPLDETAVREALDDLPILASLPLDPELRARSLRGAGVQATAVVGKALQQLVDSCSTQDRNI